MALFSVAVEGINDEAVVRRLCQHTGHTVGPVHVAQGKRNLDRKLQGFNNAAKYAHWLVVRDLDHDADCAPTLITRLVSEPASYLLLRIPVRTIESWLLADREGIARYLAVSPADVPSNPELLDRPKRTLVDLARKSSRRDIRRDMVPAQGLSSEVGMGYSARILEFALMHWQPDSAGERSDSLARCLRALRSTT